MAYILKIGLEFNLPEEKPEAPLSEELAQTLHTILFEVDPLLAV